MRGLLGKWNGLPMPAPGSDARYRLDVASRVIAAFVGGYLLTTLITGLLSYLLPGTRAQSVLTATMLSFAIYSAIVIWAFSVRTTAHVWRSLVVAIGASGVALWLTRTFLA